MKRSKDKGSYLDSRRAVISDSDDSDSFMDTRGSRPRPVTPLKSTGEVLHPVSRNFAPLKSPNSPLVFRPIVRKRPAPDSTSTSIFKDKNRIASSSAGSTSKKPVYNRLPLVSRDDSVRKEREREREDEGRKHPIGNDITESQAHRQQHYDRNVPGSSSSYRREYYEDVPSSSARYQMKQRNQPILMNHNSFDEDEEDEENVNALLHIINKRRMHAKKARIEKAFQTIHTPMMFFENQQSYAEKRIKNYEKYESAMRTFKKHTEAIMKQHEGIADLFTRMMESISKGVTRIGIDMAEMQNGTKTCFENLKKAGESYSKLMEESGKDSIEKYEDGLDNWKQQCLDEVEDQTLDCLETIVKYI